MKRRNFLISTGLVASGASAALGTGATMYSVNDRKNSIDVVSDSSGVIGFDDTSPGDIVNETNGKIEIDFAERSGSDGVNVGSEIVLGDIRGDEPGESYGPFSDIGDPSIADGSAFRIVNQAKGTELQFTFTYEPAEGFNVNKGGSVLAFYFTHFPSSGHSELQVRDQDDAPNDYDAATGNFVQSGVHDAYPDEGVGSGEAIDVALAIDTNNTNSSTQEDLSGTLTVEAVPVNST